VHDQRQERVRHLWNGGVRRGQRIHLHEGQRRGGRQRFHEPGRFVHQGRHWNAARDHDGAATFKGKLAAFLVYAYGGPSTITYTDGVAYSGMQNMVGAHTGLAITSDQYDYFITNIVVPALTDNGVTTPDVSSCFAPTVTDTSFKASIVGH
jgi:hypothetical protein